MRTALKGIDDGSDVQPSKATLSAYLTRWLAAVKDQLRPTSHSAYELSIRKHIKPGLGNVRLQDLTTSRINAFYGQLKDAGVGARTIVYAHQTLRKALGDAARWSELTRNAAEFANPPRNKRKAEMRVWNATEVRAFLDAAKDDRLAAAFTVAASTGLRRGELLGLRWRDLNLTDGWLQVVQTVTLVRYKIVMSTPKTEKGRRRVTLDGYTVSALKQHRLRVLEERLALGRGAPGDDDLVFAQPDGGPVHPETLGGAFSRYLTAAGLPRIRLHDLRHSHATLMLAANVHPKVVSERLGHANIGITLDIYSHVIPGMQEEAAAKVGSLLFGS